MTATLSPAANSAVFAKTGDTIEKIPLNVDLLTQTVTATPIHGDTMTLTLSGSVTARNPWEGAMRFMEANPFPVAYLSGDTVACLIQGTIAVQNDPQEVDRFLDSAQFGNHCLTSAQRLFDAGLADSSIMDFAIAVAIDVLHQADFALDASVHDDYADLLGWAAAA